MIDMRETAIQTGGPLAQGTLTTKTGRADVRAATPQPRCPPLRVLKSEQIRLWSLRATRVTAVLMLVPTTTISLLVLLFTDVSSGTQLLAIDTTIRMFTAIDLIFAVVLGDMFAAGEFSAGSIQPSLGAVPNRELLVVAKIMVLTLSVLILSVLVVDINVVLGLIVLPTQGVEQSLESPAVRIIVGLCLYSMLTGLFSFCIGFPGRSNVGTISVTLGILWILPSVIRMPGGGEIAQTIMAWLPGVAGSQTFTLEPASSTGGVWDDLAILAANVVMMSMIAVGQFKRLNVWKTRIYKI